MEDKQLFGNMGENSDITKSLKMSQGGMPDLKKTKSNSKKKIQQLPQEDEDGLFRDK